MKQVPVFTEHAYQMMFTCKVLHAETQTCIEILLKPLWFEFLKTQNFIGQFSTLKNLMAVVGTTCDLTCRSRAYSENVSRGGSQRVHNLGEGQVFPGWGSNICLA